VDKYLLKIFGIVLVCVSAQQTFAQPSVAQHSDKSNQGNLNKSNSNKNSSNSSSSSRSIINERLASPVESKVVPLRDPTQPFSYSSKYSKREAPKLQAIFFGNGRKEAIINGTLLREGDRFGEHRVIKISSDRVSSSIDGVAQTLTLRSSIFEKP
jgi:hypothetical protein